MMRAPLVISIYNRLEHLKRCVASLKADPLAGETDLFVVSDAPYIEAHRKMIEEVRAYVPTIEGFHSVHLIAWKENKGSTKSITDARAQVLEQYETLIFMEDDNIVSPHFLTYLNEGLEKYRDDPHVYCICGYNYNMPIPKDYPYDCYFIYSISAYGYGVWREKYNNFYSDYKVPNFRSKIYRRFSRRLNQPAFFMKRMMKQGKIWGDVRVTYYLYSHNMVCLFPCHSLVLNTGYDNSGEHSGKMRLMQQDIAKSGAVEKFPPTCEIYPQWEKALSLYFKYPWWKRMKTTLYDWMQAHKKR